MTAVVLMAVDTSLTATGIAIAPADYDGQRSRITSATIGEKLSRAATDEERIRRAESIALRLVTLARSKGVTVAYFESYAFHQRTAAHSLGELGGIVRLELLRAGIEIRTAPMASARKLLLGKLPKSDVKGVVFKTLHDAGFTFNDFDQADAFVVLNYAMSEIGGYTLAQLEPGRAA